MSFSQKTFLNRGILYFYKAGRNKLEVSAMDSFTSDGNRVFHYSKGRGLITLGVNDGLNSMVGGIKDRNYKEPATFDSVSILWYQGKLYIRHYGLKPIPFEVYNPVTLEKDQEVSKKAVEFFKAEEERLKEEREELVLEEGQEPPVQRSLLWSKDTKTGRSLDISPIFSDGTYFYVVAT